MAKKQMRWVVSIPGSPGEPRKFEKKRDAEVYALAHHGTIAHRLVRVAANTSANEPEKVAEPKTVDTPDMASSVSESEPKVATPKPRGRPRKTAEN